MNESNYPSEEQIERLRAQVQNTNFKILIAAIVVLSLITTASVLILELFHSNVNGENQEIIHILIAILSPIITALLALALQQVKGAVTEVHLATNSRLDQLLKETRIAAHAEGAASERQLQKVST